MKFHTSGFKERGQGGECIPSVFNSGSYGGSLGGVKANAVGLDVMGRLQRKQKIISQQKKLEQNNEQHSYSHSYSGKRLLSDVHANTAIEKNNHVTIVAFLFLLEWGTCARVIIIIHKQSKQNSHKER